MPSFDGAGCSKNTPIKQEHFSKFLRMHMDICRGLIGRGKVRSPYFFFDLHAGPGVTYGMEGSPLIFQRQAAKYPFPCRSFHFERTRQGVRELRKRFDDIGAELGRRPDAHVIVPGPHEATVCAMLEEFAEVGSLYPGLIYADPNGGEIPVAVINSILAVPCFRRLDVLIGVNSTAIKRVRGRFPESGRPSLAHQLGAIAKDTLHIREPYGRWQFSMAVKTGWAGLPCMERQGFHDVRTEHGAAILEHINSVGTPRPLPPAPKRRTQMQLDLSF